MNIDTAFILTLLNATKVSENWSGIAVVGQERAHGQVFKPCGDVRVKENNFGSNDNVYGPASTDCNCKFYTSGGSHDNSVSNAVIEADPRNNTNRILVRMTVSRRFHTMTCINDQALMMCGGFESTSGTSILASCEICHIATAQCQQITSMPYHASQNSAVYNDGHLYIIGGSLYTWYARWLNISFKKPYAFAR